MPGHEKIVSVRIAPARSWPTWSPTTVSTGRSAFQSAWRRTTAVCESPFASAVRMYSQTAVVLRHALWNALLPVLTVVGLQVGQLLAGAILTETIFSWPGIGLWVYESIEARDYAIVQGASLFIAAIVVVVNLATDLLYALVDPRIKYD